jgi:hypothetical protein
MSLSMKPRTLPAFVVATGPSFEGAAAAIEFPISDQTTGKPLPTTKPLMADRRLIFDPDVVIMQSS